MNNMFDKIKDKVQAQTQGKESSTTSATAGTTGKEDYVDKFADAVNSKTGGHLSRDQLEKGTDEGREMFEKKTGKHVPDSVSN